MAISYGGQCPGLKEYYDTGKSFDSIMYEVNSEMEYKTFFKLFVGITIDDKNFMDSTIYNFV